MRGGRGIQKSYNGIEPNILYKQSRFDILDYEKVSLLIIFNIF